MSASTYDEAEANRRLAAALRVIAALRENIDELEPEGDGRGCPYCPSTWRDPLAHDPDCPYRVVLDALAAYDAATAEDTAAAA
jgi:hypothetical protein